MTVSLWRRSTSPTRIDCDTAVLGGGIMGVASALALEASGVDALIIERGQLGAGASTRNAGYLMRGAADNYAAGVRDWGRPLAKLVWQHTEQNLQMLRSRGIESLPTFRSAPSCLLALGDAEAAELRDSLSLMRQDGFDVSMQQSGTDALWRSGKALCGLVNPHDACCNPKDVLLHLASSLRREPLLHQEAVHIAIEGPQRVVIRTQDTQVHATRAIVATNAYAAQLLPRLADLIQPKRGQILAFRTPTPAFDASYYANHGGEYFRQASPDVAIIGGWRRFFEHTEVGYEDRTTDGVQQGLEQFIRQFVPAPLDVVARWSGVMGFTPDGLPLVGPIRADGAPAAKSPLWISAGCTGHGMSMFFKTAHDAVASLLHGTDNPFHLARPTLCTADDPSGILTLQRRH